MSGKDLVEIGESLRRIVGSRPAIYMRAGKVKSVDESAGTCSVVLTGDEDATEGVLLNAVSNNANGWMLIPKVGSVVWIGHIDGDGLIGVLRYSDISKMTVNVNGGTAEIEMLSGKIVMNGGSLGGMLKVEQSVQQWNALQNDINQLKTALTTVLTANATLLASLPTTGPVPASNMAIYLTAFQTALNTYAAAALALTTRTSVENTNVKQ